MGNKYSGKKVDMKEVQCYNVKDLVIMLDIIKERRSHKKKMTTNCNMHMLEKVTLMI